MADNRPIDAQDKGSNREGVREWLRSWWVTYVQMSRRERRNIIAAINDPDAEYVEAPRPVDTGALATRHLLRGHSGEALLCEECIAATREASL